MQRLDSYNKKRVSSIHSNKNKQKVAHMNLQSLLLLLEANFTIIFHLYLQRGKDLCLFI